MVSMCLPSDPLPQHLPSYLGFSYVGRGVSLHGCSSKVQLILLTLDEGYLLTAAPPDLERGVAPLSPPLPTQPPLLGCGVACLSTSWQIDGETERGTDFILGGGSKITGDGDFSNEIKRRLLLGRKTMTNLDSILKSRDITLPTKVHLVKAMVFPVVMYGCESWTIKKAECWRIDAFELDMVGHCEVQNSDPLSWEYSLQLLQ